MGDQQEPVVIEAYDDEIEPSQTHIPPPSPPSPPSPSPHSPSPPPHRNQLFRSDEEVLKSEKPRNVASNTEQISSSHTGAVAATLTLTDPPNHTTTTNVKRRSRKQEPQEPSKKSRSTRSSGISLISSKYEPRLVQLVKKPKTIVDHTYHDLSNIPVEADDYFSGASISDNDEMDFPKKVFEVLSKKEFHPYINWMSHGRAFRVLVPKRLESKVAPKYFKHSRYSTFLRQLNNYGFKHITQGKDRNSFYHEAFLKGLPHLIKFMPRPKNRRRLTPDPENEPDFYRISEMYPLPEGCISFDQVDEEVKQQKPEARKKDARVKLSLPAPGASVTTDSVNNFSRGGLELTAATLELEASAQQQQLAARQHEDSQVLMRIRRQDHTTNLQYCQQLEATRQMILGQVSHHPLQPLQSFRRGINQHPFAQLPPLPIQHPSLFNPSAAAAAAAAATATATATTQAILPLQRQQQQLAAPAVPLDRNALLLGAMSHLGTTERILGLGSNRSAMGVGLGAHHHHHQSLNPFGAAVAAAAAASLSTSSSSSSQAASNAAQQLSSSSSSILTDFLKGLDSRQFK